MAASIWRSIPAQNDEPAPVTITTREWLFSTVSSAVCSSAIICVLMALRLSGRFSVIFAISPVNSRINVECMESTSLIHNWSVRVFGPNLVGHSQYLGEPGGVDARIGARFVQRGEHLLRRNIADQIVSCKGAAAKPG